MGFWKRIELVRGGYRALDFLLPHFLRKRTNYWRFHFSYIVTMGLVGSILLYLFQLGDVELPLAFIDSLFLSFSAVTCTGLVSVDFAQLRTISKVTIMIWIQMGNIVGLSTIPLIYRFVFLRRQVAFIKKRLRKKGGFVLEKDKQVLNREEQRIIEYLSTRKLLVVCTSFIVAVYFICFLGFLVYIYSSSSARQILEDESPGTSVFFWALFHTVSSFSNAGFCLFTSNLVPFQSHSFILITTMFLIAAGNTAYPIILRVMLSLERMAYSLSMRSSKETTPLTYLLSHSRESFTHLFPRNATRSLLLTWFSINSLQFLLFMILEWNSSGELAKFAFHSKILVSMFQSVTTRTAGFNVVPLADEQAGMQAITVVFMYVAAYPFVLTLHESAKLKKQQVTLDELYGGDVIGGGSGDGGDSVVSSSKKASSSSFSSSSSKKLLSATSIKRDALKKTLNFHLQKVVLTDVTWLFMAWFLICATDSPRAKSDVSASPFVVLFELVSAYGTVGLSLGYPLFCCSFAGTLSSFGKFCVIVVMIMGKHRGLPHSLDVALQVNADLDRGDSARKRKRKVRFGDDLDDDTDASSETDSFHSSRLSDDDDRRFYESINAMTVDARNAVDEWYELFSGNREVLPKPSERTVKHGDVNENEDDSDMIMTPPRRRKGGGGGGGDVRHRKGEPPSTRRRGSVAEADGFNVPGAKSPWEGRELDLSDSSSENASTNYGSDVDNSKNENESITLEYGDDAGAGAGGDGFGVEEEKEEVEIVELVEDGGVGDENDKGLLSSRSTSIDIINPDIPDEPLAIEMPDPQLMSAMMVDEGGGGEPGQGEDGISMIEAQFETEASGGVRFRGSGSGSGSGSGGPSTSNSRPPPDRSRHHRRSSRHKSSLESPRPPITENEVVNDSFDINIQRSDSEPIEFREHPHTQRSLTNLPAALAHTLGSNPLANFSNRAWYTIHDAGLPVPRTLPLSDLFRGLPSGMTWQGGSGSSGGGKRGAMPDGWIRKSHELNIGGGRTVANTNPSTSTTTTTTTAAAEAAPALPKTLAPPTGHIRHRRTKSENVSFNPQPTLTRSTSSQQQQQDHHRHRHHRAVSRKSIDRVEVSTVTVHGTGTKLSEQMKDFVSSHTSPSVDVVEGGGVRSGRPHHHRMHHLRDNNKENNIDFAIFEEKKRRMMMEAVAKEAKTRQNNERLRNEWYNFYSGLMGVPNSPQNKSAAVEDRGSGSSAAADGGGGFLNRLFRRKPKRGNVGSKPETVDEVGEKEGKRKEEKEKKKNEDDVNVQAANNASVSTIVNISALEEGILSEARERSEVSKRELSDSEEVESSSSSQPLSQLSGESTEESGDENFSSEIGERKNLSSSTQQEDENE